MKSLGFIIFLAAILGTGDNLLNRVHSCVWATGLSEQDLALLIHSENTASCSLGRLLESNGCNKGGLSVTDQRIWQALFHLEGGVGLRRVPREAKDREASGGQMCVVVTEQACLLSACVNGELVHLKNRG